MLHGSKSAKEFRWEPKLDQNCSHVCHRRPSDLLCSTVHRLHRSCCVCPPLDVYKVVSIRPSQPHHDSHQRTQRLVRDPQSSPSSRRPSVTNSCSSRDLSTSNELRPSLLAEALLDVVQKSLIATTQRGRSTFKVLVTELIKLDIWIWLEATVIWLGFTRWSWFIERRRRVGGKGDRAGSICRGVMSEVSVAEGW